MPQTIHQRRQLHRVAQHPSVRAYQQNQRAHYEGELAALRYEQGRAERIDAQLQADATAVGPTDGAEVEPAALTGAECARIIGCGFLAMSAMLAFGYVAAPLFLRLLAALRTVLA